ncbi:signal peptidase I [Otoolea muris]|uniref:signal peptidase I n=1 Tax=Otoolea muris TaxID=2941515 RepID=UPI002041D870|nr:signal peptidase I [Otoolea muris]
MPEKKTSRAREGNILGETIRDMLQILKTVLFVTAAMMLLNGFMIANAVIPTSSMSPAIKPGDRVIGLRFLRDYKRGDIVVFDDPEVEGRYLIKRIIGMPGDQISFITEEDGACSVSVNGVKLEEPYLPETMLFDPEFGKLSLKIPEDSYFCLGDNRNNSRDARYWERKLITRDEIVAKAVLRYWPAPRARLFVRPDYMENRPGMS